MKPASVILTLLVLLGIAGALAWWVWRELGEVTMSGHGVLALILGAALSFLLGAGLMFLVFFSSRRGYDDIERRD